MNKIKPVIIAFILVFLTSCLTPRFYTPNRNPLPLFKKKGDVYIDISSNFLSKVDATVGYAIFNGLGGYAGVGASTQSSSSVILRPEVPFKCNGNIQNYGLGYFLPEKQSKRFRFEIFGDVALGKYEIIKYATYGYTPSGPTAYLNGQYTKIGILTNLGHTDRKRIVQYGCTARFSNLEFYNPSYIEKKRLYYETERLNSKRDYYLLEAGIYGKIGRKAVKGQLELAFYNGIHASDDINAVQNFNFSLMVGLVINLNVFSMSKNKSNKSK